MNISLERQCGNQNRLEDLGFDHEFLEAAADFWGMDPDEMLTLDECTFEYYLMIAERMGV